MRLDTPMLRVCIHDITSLRVAKIHFLLMFVAHLAIATYIMAAYCTTIVYIVELFLYIPA